MPVAGIVIIGAGVGGLAAAIELAAAGEPVTLLERAPMTGGKLHTQEVDGTAIDAGPTVLTMRPVFERLFAVGGARLDDCLELEPAAILARHAWSAEQRLDLHADVGASTAAIGDFAGAAAAKGFARFATDAARIYRTLEQPFLFDSLPDPLTLARRVGLSRLADLMQIRPFTPLWRALGDYFSDPRLQQLFGRYATYSGASPYAAPATLMLIAHVEQQGVWRIRGGMQRLATALTQLARDCGVDVRCNADVRRLLVKGGAVRGVELGSGEQLACRAAIVNGDASAVASGLFGPEAARAVRPSRQRSLSAVTWCLHATTRGFPLSHHNVFFSGDYAREFRELTRERRLPGSPTVYVCAADRTATADARVAGRERLMLLVNAPATGDRTPASAEEIAACESATHRLLAHCGLTIDRDPSRVRLTTPTDFARRFPATGGALYGPALHGWRASFRRPASRTAIPGLYLAGGSVHPGPGLPMAALSGKLAAAAVLADCVSTTRSRTTVTDGGTSTRSATTVNSGSR